MTNCTNQHIVCKNIVVIFIYRFLFSKYFKKLLTLNLFYAAITSPQGIESSASAGYTLNFRPQRCAESAKFLGLAGTTTDELVDALIAHIQEMNRALDIPTCIKDYEGGIIDEQEFLDKLPSVAELAVGDACTGSNPRSINPEQMAKLLKCCFYDTEVDF